MFLLTKINSLVKKNSKNNIFRKKIGYKSFKLKIYKV